LIVVRTLGGLGDPLGVVSRAVKEKRSAEGQGRREKDLNAIYDQVWCLIDVDEHERLKQALEVAGKEGVHVALSNPCFELWPVLHLAQYAKPSTVADLAKVLATHMPGYDKHLDAARLVGAFGTAKKRALALDAGHSASGDRTTGGLGNPATSVWRLVDHLVAAAQASNPGLQVHL
jgi:hypothetical protein